MSPVRVVNVADIAEPGWRFLEPKVQAGSSSWSFHAATPTSWIERFVKRPNLARLRASLQAGFRARGSAADLIISHLPRTTLWVGVFSRLFGSQARHVAFAFNFTKLPTGINKRLMCNAFRRVDRFVVFSQAERQLYADYFSIDPARFDVIHWCMDLPKTAPLKAALPAQYICAVGGEGRDYRSLLAACRQLPHVPVVIVARPDSIRDLDIPPHVQVFTNIKNEEFWGIVRESRFVVLPLKDAATNCGHISIVGSQLLGKPIVSTFSAGTSDYLQHRHNALMGSAGDTQALGQNIQQLWEDHVLYDELQARTADGGKQYALAHWVAYFEQYFESLRSVRSNGKNAAGN